MPDGSGGITILQLLEQEVELLKKQLNGINAAENTSIACPRIAKSIQNGEDMDGFLVKEGGASEANQFHTSVGSSTKNGCCVLL